MSSVQTTASTPRQNRILNVGLLVLGVVVLAAGIGVLAWKLTSGSSSTASRSAGNAAQTMLPAHQPKTLPKVPYSKLDPQIHTAVQTFLTTAVPRKDIAAS